MEKVPINTEFIKLSQFLKWTNIAETGALANHIITEQLVKVNDEVEVRRGRKLYPGDNVKIKDIGEFLVVREGSANFVSQGIDSK